MSEIKRQIKELQDKVKLQRDELEPRRAELEKNTKNCPPEFEECRRGGTNLFFRSTRIEEAKSRISARKIDGATGLSTAFRSD